MLLTSSISKAEVFDSMALAGTTRPPIKHVRFFTDGAILNGTWDNEDPLNRKVILFSMEVFTYQDQAGKQKYRSELIKMRKKYPDWYIILYTGGVDRRYDNEELQAKWKTDNDAKLAMVSLPGPDIDEITSEVYYTHFPIESGEAGSIEEHTKLYRHSCAEGMRLIGDSSLVHSVTLQPYQRVGPSTVSNLVPDVILDVYIAEANNPVNVVTNTVIWGGGFPAKDSVCVPMGMDISDWPNPLWRQRPVDLDKLRECIHAGQSSWDRYNWTDYYEGALEDWCTRIIEDDQQRQE